LTFRGFDYLSIKKKFTDGIKEVSKEGPPHAPIFTYKCTVKNKEGEDLVVVKAKSIKAAKKICSHLLLEKLKSGKCTSKPKSSITSTNMELDNDHDSSPTSSEESELADLDYECSTKCDEHAILSDECVKRISHMNHRFQLWNDEFLTSLKEQYVKTPYESMNLLKKLGEKRGLEISYRDLPYISKADQQKFSKIVELKNSSSDDEDSDREEYEEKDENESEGSDEEDLGDYKSFVILDTTPSIVHYGYSHNDHNESQIDSAKNVLKHLFSLIQSTVKN